MDSYLKRWTAAEDDLLRQGWPIAPPEELSLRFPDRTWEAVRTRAKRLRLRRPDGYRAPPRSRALRFVEVAKRPGTSWTPERKELLAYLFPSAPWRILLLAFPESKQKAIGVQACKQGLFRGPVRRNQRSWTPELLARLRELYSWTPEEDLAAAFPGYSRKALEAQASKRGIKRCRRFDLPPTVQPNPGEIWRAIRSFSGQYWVSTSGRVAGTRGLMRPLVGGGGHPTVWLSRGPKKKRTSRGIAQLVLDRFIKPATKAYVPGYRDGNPLNFALENLFWRPFGRAITAKADPVKFAPLGEALRYALSRDGMYAAAMTALRRFPLTPYDRDDIATDMYVEHLAGGLPVEDCAARAAEFVKAHNRNFGRLGVVSLDQTVRGTDDLRLGDMLSDDEYRERWAALT